MTKERFESGRKEAILRAAEAVFADRSYEGASIRKIADAAGVNLALVGYYFGAKDELYREIFARRYREMNDERFRRLDAVQIVPGSAASVRAILSAVFEPFVERLDTDEGRRFARLLAREASDPSNAERGLIKTFLDPLARRFMERLAEAIPTATAAEVAWGFQFSIALMVSSVTTANRVRILSDGATANMDRQVLLDGMVTFATAGIMALIERSSDE